MTWSVFLTLWFSSFVLEIWTFHTIRPDREPDPSYEADFAAGYRRATLHLGANATLVVVWLVLRVVQLPAA